MRIYLKNDGNHLRLHFNSKYASGSHPVSNIEDLMSVINQICSEGSFCLYQGKNDLHPKPIDFSLYKKYKGKWPEITYFQQAVKTEVIEQARDVAKEVWGNIPELEGGWLENRLRAYVEDIKE